MLKLQNILLLIIFIIWDFGFSSNTIFEDNNSSLIELSVYDGEGSLLLEWFYPDSIQQNTVRIFSKNNSHVDFSLVSEFSSDKKMYLDLNCKPNERIFYIVEIEDFFGKIYSSDSNTPAFGSCQVIVDSLSYDSTISSLKQLSYKQLLYLTKLNNSMFDFSFFIEILEDDFNSKNDFLEKIPIELLKNSNIQFQIFDRLINSDSWVDSLLIKKSVYSNHLLLRPDNWQKKCFSIVDEIRSNWNTLFSFYPDAINFLDNIEPIRIVSLKILNDLQKSLSLYIFNRKSLDFKEIYLLSKDEYININDFILFDKNFVSLNIPNNWDKVSLMVDDSVMQTCRTVFDSSIFYTLNSDIIPYDPIYHFKSNINESLIWMNEVLWNPGLRNLELELAGQTNFDTIYSFYLNDELLWELENSNNL